MDFDEAAKLIEEEMRSLPNLVFSGYFYNVMVNGLKDRSFHTAKVFDAIKPVNRDPRVLELPENVFKHLPLRGYSKVHFQQPGFLIKAINQFWKKGNRLEDAINKAHSKTNDKKIAASRLAHAYSIEAFHRLEKNGGLAGEWIIFWSLGDMAIVLCFGRHGDDVNIAELISKIRQHPFIYFGSRKADFEEKIKNLTRTT